MADGEAQPKKSDLGVRTASAVVMLAVAGTALWLGGRLWSALVLLLAAGVLWEWTRLSFAFARSLLMKAAWFLWGVIYIGGAATLLELMRGGAQGFTTVLMVLMAVIATDVGAYFAGRSIGGPKIAPKISPSKTWAGLAGGMAGAVIALIAVYLLHSLLAPSGIDQLTGRPLPPLSFAQAWAEMPWLGYLVSGIGVAIVAQAGDFFESWMKRRAGVKDSGRLIPGHGGLFDRVDGLLAVCFALFLLSFHSLFVTW